jgi:hypothetical protein
MESFVEGVVDRVVGIGSPGLEKSLLLSAVRRPIREELSFCEPGGRKISNQPAVKEEADAVYINRPVLSEKFGIFPQFRGLGKDLMDFDDVGPTLLKDIRPNGGKALVSQRAITQKSEIDDLHIPGKEHHGSHIGSGVGKVFPAGYPQKIREDGCCNANPVNGDPRHVHRSFLRT